MPKIFRLGLDVGSTTAKCVVLDEQDNFVYTNYIRHNTHIVPTVIQILNEIKQQLGHDILLSVKVTGSAGMGISEKADITFIQEVVAASEVVQRKYPDVRTLIDIGGEDSKMIFFFPDRPPDIRMNGSCAGGTGAFIDQMATLLNVPVSDFDTLAKNHDHIYPIASRCGVFAKTDVQNLISRNVSKENIAYSVLHAVCIQLVNTLARGYDIIPKVMLIGGPFSFIPTLGEAALETLKLQPDDLVSTEHPTLLSAWGSAIHTIERTEIGIEALIDKLTKSTQVQQPSAFRLKPLFNESLNFDDWQKKRRYIVIPRVALSDYTKANAFLGIDSGSTTTKITLVSEDDELLFTYYAPNNGHSIKALITGLNVLKEEIQKSGKQINIARTGVTGYGEELLKAAFSLDDGLVETMAHYAAAKHIQPNVSFIMDIGGQDMKAIFIANGVVNNIELNEACSSGCGSFIETFAKSLNSNTIDFAKAACHSSNPCDLGTRCTVFMNSKVKQALRENATVGDISAGLAFSVIKNAIYKVLKLHDMSKLGQHIVVQGGTFKNPAVFRALEQLTGAEISSSDIPELMGAYGSALVAKNNYQHEATPSRFIGLDHLVKAEENRAKDSRCKGCENNCDIIIYRFANGQRYYSGNKCERLLSNNPQKSTQTFNMFDYKNELLFDRVKEQPAIKPRLTLGIPRVLGMYENFPFWHTLFTECNIGVTLSPYSTMPIYEKGSGTIMSDSICFPAKLVHGHIVELAEQKQADRIFMPMVVLESQEFSNATNNYNCPIVSSYSEVVNSAINPEIKYGMPFDYPVINFTDIKLLRKGCLEYCKTLGIDTKLFEQAFTKALNAQADYKKALYVKSNEVLAKAKEDNRYVFILAGRPYHSDSLINHKTPEILNALGCDVITEDSVLSANNTLSPDLQICSQWSYPNRLYAAANFVANEPNNIQFVQLNSFGCGPDAIVTDECKAILEAKGKTCTIIRVDEITATGSVRLRLRSILESLKLNRYQVNRVTPRQKLSVFMQEDKQRRTILAPFISEFYSPLLPPLFALSGYRLETLPKPDKSSVEWGLKYCNNEICYPATIIVGDVIKALHSGKYNRDEVAIGITQTGGQCRASSYLSLIKKAMISNGFGDIPIISLSGGNITEHEQPGFKLNWMKTLPAAFIGMLFADAISKMYYSIAPREVNKGDANRVRDAYLDTMEKYIAARKSYKEIYALLEKAVMDFNHLPIHNIDCPQVGVVGEIYVKYNSFGNQNSVDWLVEQGIEPVIPPMLEFFSQSFVNLDSDIDNYLARKGFASYLIFFLEKIAQRHVNKVNKILSNFKYYQPFHDIRDMAEKAKEILNLSNQFGEGWLIPAGIMTFAEQGINNVISLQPFGCIANHVVSKGVEKRMRDLHPKLNLLYLDFDDGAGEVNVLNRLHFIVSSLKYSQLERIV
ncbi:acyl-CoA dehydratase activase-related protein [Zophobihabitans entericus]|uniref:CoA protein activase n=1 Tax=Zophobihabitans entericus TaxID=1635327 RepID=A0A6G9ICD1_9GAMM|nr:acyl-CoA dehydratase activase-related protein [Zophobihabitans entericus]QIQ21364.1 CoA protein activase [Zophobihabitans entericus]